MAANNAFSRFLIVNGQPILIKHDLMGLNQVQSLGSDILQQAIDDVTSSDSISAVINCTSDDIIESEQDAPICMDEANSGRSEYVTVLSSDQNTDETSTIRLTLEQAAELGLRFTIDGMDQMLEINNLGDKEDANDSNQNNFEIPMSLCNEQNAELSNKLESEIPCSLAHDVDTLNKTNDGYLSALNSIDTSQTQQLSLVPQIINGTVTYTLQLTNQPSSQANGNEFFRIDDHSIVSQDSNARNASPLKLDVNNITGTTDLSFMSSPVDLVSNKFSNKHVNNSREGDDSCQAYGLVSCDSDNVTFLSLSDAIPVGTSVSNIVSHMNNTSSTQQSKLSVSSSSIPENMPKSKIFVISNGGSSDSSLMKQKDGESNLHNSRISVSVQSEMDIVKSENSPEHVRSIVFAKSNVCDNISNLLSKAPFQNSSNSRPNFNFVEKDVSIQSPSKFHATSSSSINEEMDIDVHPSLARAGECVEENTDNSSDVKQIPTIITPAGGDVPEEVSLALRRIPIKTDINKPLGSNENPIKLVQQGSTFHSMQALTEDHISKIKPILQENFESKIPSKNIVFDPASNTRIIYRIISPAEVSLRKQDEFPRRRGRPKKVRPAENPAEEVKDGAPPPKKVFPRTRSGRLSRPPKHMVRDYKHIRRPELDDSDGGYSDYQSENEDDSAALPAAEPVDLLPGLVAKTKNHKRNISAGNLCPTCGKVYLGYVRMKRHFDKYPDHGSIEYLNTVHNSNPDSEAENQLDGQNGLWKKGAARKKGKGRNNGFVRGDKRTRLKETLDWCQTKDIVDIAGPAVASALSLWELLLLRVDCVKEDSQVAALYKELRQLLSKLRQMAHRLFRPLDHTLPPGTKHVTVQVEDEMMTGLLNLPCGVYLASDEDLTEPSLPTAKSLPVEESHVINSPLLKLVENKETGNTVQDTETKMVIDEVPQPFLLPGEELICDTDDRVLVNVDDIVSERLENFTGSQSSSVDELMKGLNELEQRNKLEADDLMEEFSIVSQTNHVSASTEDLMKSLEHFDTGLNNPDAPSSLDRDTFDRVTNVDTLDFEVLSREFHSNNR